MAGLPQKQSSKHRALLPMISCFAITGASALAGPYSPAPGQGTSTAIPASSTNIVEWASGATIVRGWRNIENQAANSTDPSSQLNYAFYGGSDGASAAASNASIAAGGGALANTANAAPIGIPPQPQPTSYAVALGQNGSATLTFNQPITNGSGPDFAVFGNGFSSGAQEWVKPALVQVSSDGVHFFSFPTVSLTQTATQVSSYGELDPTNLYNIAGNFPAGYGTPFDLNEIANVSPLLNVNDVTQVRILSIAGDINPSYATHDSQGNIINSPWPAASAAGSEGFDLAGVGVLNALNSYPVTNVSMGTLDVTATNPLPANTALTIGGGAQVILNPRIGLVTLSSLNLDPAGKIDLTDNAIVIHNGNLAQITTAIQTGSNNLGWIGSNGIMSSTAAADSNHLTAIGVMQNSSASGSVIYTTSFDGATNLNLTANDVLVRYTYYGDTNLDGQVDGSDYSSIDNGFLTHATGWQNGDLNYDGIVDGSDYTLIDNAFNQQGGTPTAAVVTSQIALPEPTLAGLFCAGLATLVRRRRK